MRRGTVKKLNPPYATHNAKGMTASGDDAESEYESESADPLFIIFMVPPAHNGDEEWKNGLYINSGTSIDPWYPHSTPRCVGAGNWTEEEYQGSHCFTFFSGDLWFPMVEL